MSCDVDPASAGHADDDAALPRAQIIGSLLDAIDAMLAYWDAHEICRFANRAYYEWFGITPEALIDKMSIRDLLGEALYKKNKPYLSAAYAGQRQVFERAIPVPNGGFRRCLLTYYPHVVGSVVKGIFVHGADIGALVRSADTLDPVRLGPYTFDIEQNCVARAGVAVDLTPREFSLARYFFSRPGQVISRDELCLLALGLNPRVVTRTLDTHVSRMRRKLQLDGRHGVLLVSAYQRGYVLKGG